MQENAFEKIPRGFVKKWQEIADLIAAVMHVPAALLMKTENEYMEVFTSSKTENNPYKVGDKDHWYGLYCETVIKTQKKLRIPNALKNKHWDKNPDIKLGMIAYLGYPINFPDQKPFGTLCVLDKKERQFSAENEKLLLQFKKVIELDLALIFSLGLKDESTHASIIQKLSNDNEEYQAINEELQQTEEALREREDKLSKILMAANDGMWDWDLRTNTVFFDPRYYQMSGYDVDEFPHHLEEFQKRVHPGDAGYVMNEAEKHLKGEMDRFDVKFRFWKKSGDWQWIQGKGIIVERDEDGVPQRFVGTHRDISELKQVEEQLRESEVKFKSVFESANVGKSITQPTGEINVNLAFCDLLGYTPTELQNKKWQDITPVDEIESIEKILDPMLKGETNTARFEKRYIHKNGSIIWADVSVAIYRNAEGQPLYFLTTVVDINERKQSEQLLKESEERFKALHNASFGGIAIHDKGLILECNQGLSEITGYALDELIGMDGLLLIAPESRDMVMGNILAGYEKPYEVVGLRKHGELYPIRLEARNIPYKGKTVRTVEFRDITEQKIAEGIILKLNEELEQRVFERTAQLEASNKELEAFTYSVSHDLRAPLRHINGYISLLNEKFNADLPEKAQYYLTTISDAAGQMGTLIDELLQFSRTGRQEVQKTIIEMNKLVKEVVENLKHDTEKREIHWDVKELPQMFGDYSLLKQVWVNLLDNAVKFSRNKKPAEISIGCKEEEKNFVFFIRDNGVGFDMKYAHKLFGVFQRLHSLAEFEGTGIGLAHVQRIIHKHNGRVWAEAEPGKGATFFFSLPK